jgi:hypothetical protein
MFTSEELEDCDIFPKKITFNSVLKFLIYLIIMIIAVVTLLSIYTGKDMKFVISLDNFKYSSYNEVYEKLYHLDKRFDYNLNEKYNFDYENTDENYFIKEYVSQSIPCIFRNLTDYIPFFKEFTSNDSQRLSIVNDIFSNYEFDVEKKDDPASNFFHGNVIIEKLNYLDFFERATSKEKMANYYINNFALPDHIKNKLYIENYFNMTYNLNFKGLKYSEGFSENIIPAHYEQDEQIFCQFSGSLDIIIIPQLYRNTIYNFRKGYGPQNYSPIDFFGNQLGRFPKFSKSHRLLITLNEGDCLYLPAFWWFSIKTSLNNHYQFFTFAYSSHSNMLKNLVLNLDNDDFN